MPLKPLDIDNLSTTFEKNSTDLMDAIWYGVQLQKIKDANRDIGNQYIDYSDEDKLALGLTDDISDNVMAGLIDETCNVHMTDDNPYDSFKNIMYASQKAITREALEQDALYKQVLDSLPENEPDREDKAMYLFNSSILRNTDYQNYLSDLELKALGNFQRSYDDVLDGINHGGDWEKVTVGEILDKVGLDEEQKQAFIKNHGYESLDETLLSREIRHDPAAQDKKTMARYYLGFCFQQDAKREATDAVQKEMPPEEAETITAYQNKLKQIEQSGDQKKIEGWIQEKGQKLCQDLNAVRIATISQKNRLLLESGKSLSNINYNAPLKDVLANRSEETAYVGQIIKGEKQAPELLSDLIKNGKEQLPNIEFKTAREFINEVKTELKQNPDGIEDDNRPYKQFATVFAARILANSKRGDKASLGESFSRMELNELAERLQENTEFNSFISDTYLSEDDPDYTKLKNAEQKLYSARTHGGFIEDEFKKYLLKKKPGELENSPELARFMPTAKERIEELKRQVKKDPDDLELQSAAAAEIIAIRNACKVERKSGYGLDKQIPPAPKGKRLEDEVTKLTRDNQLDDILRDDGTRRDLLSSNAHGGQMMINVRKKYDQVEKNFRDSKIESSLKKNTVSSRMQELREEAKGIDEQLGSKVPMIRNKAMQKSKEILGEYMAMVNKARQPQGVESDVPWKNAGQAIRSTMKDPAAGKFMKSPQKASEMMKAITSGDISMFQNKLTQEINAANAVKQKQGPEIAQEKIRNMQAPQDPGLG